MATNCNGRTFLRHNSLHANCVGLKAVLPNGDILDNMTSLRKDNTGYDLKQLFIGSEGTLGVITECALLCAPLPKSTHTVMLSCRTFENVQAVLQRAKSDFPDILRAVDFMDWNAMKCVLE